MDDGTQGDRGARSAPGIPLILKDNIDTADRMMTTAGSIALAVIVTEDATVTARLRWQQAPLSLARRIAERPTSARHAHERVPSAEVRRATYALDRNPCGSSSGSAVAVAANPLRRCHRDRNGWIDHLPIAPGPRWCGGHQAHGGPRSRSGIIPISHTQDTAGPIARTVADAAAILGALTGVDPRHTATHASGGRFLTDYTSSLDRDGLRGARIGIARKGSALDCRVDAIRRRPSA